jgi:mRNA interferase RelE/StbE
MAWRIEVTPEARRALDRLDSSVRRRIERFLHERVANGDPLTLSVRLTSDAAEVDLRRFRVGDYRVIARVVADVLTVMVVDVGPRGSIYRRSKHL